MSDKNEKKYLPLYVADKVLFIFFETDFFTGTAKGAGETVDLPFNRDELLGIPEYPSSSFKGAIRSYFELSAWSQNQNCVKEVFGDENKVGLFHTDDFKLLLFPVKDDHGSIAYITSDHMLSELSMILDKLGKEDLKKLVEHSTVLGVVNELNKIEEERGNRFIGLASREVEYASFKDGLFVLDVKKSDKVEKLAEGLTSIIFRDVQNRPGYSYISDLLKDNLYVVKHWLFREIVDSSLEIVTRIRVDYKTKRVEEGALFTQELVPKYSIFYSTLFRSTRRDDKGCLDNFVKELSKNISLFFGGDETIGRGLGLLIAR